MLNSVETSQRVGCASRRHSAFAHHFRAGVAGIDQFVHAANLAHVDLRGEVVFLG
jgi:hypothetical protein